MGPTIDLRLGCGHISPEELPEWPDGTGVDISCPTCGKTTPATVAISWCMCRYRFADDVEAPDTVPVAHSAHAEVWARWGGTREAGKAVARPRIRPGDLGLPKTANSFVAPEEKITQGPEHPSWEQLAANGGVIPAPSPQ